MMLPVPPHRLRKAQTALLSRHGKGGYLFCLEQGLEGFPRDMHQRSAGLYTLGLLVEGGGIVSGPDRARAVIGPGTLFQARPGQQVAMQIDRRMPYRDWLVGCDARTFERLSDLEALPEPSRSWHVRGLTAIRAAYQRLFRDLERLPRRSLAEGVCRLCEFMKEIRRSQQHPTAGVPESILKQAAELLEVEADHRPLAELFKPLGVPHERLRKAFELWHGTPPIRYRIQARIAHACRLLTEGRSVAETAEQLGYTDAFTFSKQFKAIMGEPPKRFQLGHQ